MDRDILNFLFPVFVGTELAPVPRVGSEGHRNLGLVGAKGDLRWPPLRSRTSITAPPVRQYGSADVHDRLRLRGNETAVW